MKARIWLAVARAILAAVAPAVGGSSSSGRIVFVTNHACREDCGRAEIATIPPDGSGSTAARS